MAVRIALSRAILRDATGTLLYDRVSIVGRSPDVEIRHNGTLVLTVNGATVDQVAVDVWRITAADGTVYLADRDRKGCNCGG